LTNKLILENAASTLLDPLARELLQGLDWLELFCSDGGPDHYPVVTVGSGPPVLLLHGFDSSNLEFRRLVPLLKTNNTLIIPDLFGFGFCPRPEQTSYGPELVMNHLDALLDTLPSDEGIGVIGASMGGSVAMELARRHPHRIDRLLLLAPAGLDGKPMPLPPVLDKVGVWFLGRPGVRRGLCRQAFADPDSNVGEPEIEIASLHLKVPGWARSLASFARSGGFAGCGNPLPSQPLHVLLGEQDRILRAPQKRAAQDLLGDRLESVANCGHLPHIDQPELVAQRWLGSECLS
jgi:pimeloyl-ACP methyl ester carboxylesterase